MSITCSKGYHLMEVRINKNQNLNEAILDWVMIYLFEIEPVIIIICDCNTNVCTFHQVERMSWKKYHNLKYYSCLFFNVI